jgi:protein-disulfide isomerase
MLVTKQFWIALLVIAVILGTVLVISNHGTTTTVDKGAPTQHTEGTSPEGVILLEYGDYQCPVCASFYAVTKQVAAKYATSVVFQFRNLPLVSIHQNAFAGARAVEAASIQGKFWEMHDILYESQSSWSQLTDPTPAFDSYAHSLGLNVSKFDADYASDRANNLINADLAAFNKTGDDMATPTYYLDGHKVNNNLLVDATSGQPSIDAFSKVIDAELAKKVVPAKP